MNPVHDPHCKVKVISAIHNPQQVMYAAMHQDYSENFVYDEHDRWPTESEAGKIIVDKLLAGERGHYGPLEHPQIVLNCGYFAHSVMQQARTHRVGISFDVQSMRYTGSRVIDLGAAIIEARTDTGHSDLDVLIPNLDELVDEIEKVFFFRPVGNYRDRNGAAYFYSEALRMDDIVEAGRAALNYYDKTVNKGFAFEHARAMLPFDFRQHFVVSLNVRSFMHFLDLRAKKDAQPEIQELCDHMLPVFRDWVPDVADWYERTRLGKARLSP